jgi:hypothetical protein
MDIKRFLLCFLAILIVFTMGCAQYASRFSPPVQQKVAIKLKENDYKYTKIGCTGSATVGWLFGAFPLDDPRIFSRSLADMYSQIQTDLEGKPTQLINWTLDYTVWSIFFYSKHTAVFRADLIEFQPQR